VKNTSNILYICNNNEHNTHIYGLNINIVNNFNYIHRNNDNFKKNRLKYNKLRGCIGRIFLFQFDS